MVALQCVALQSGQDQRTAMQRHVFVPIRCRTPAAFCRPLRYKIGYACRTVTLQERFAVRRCHLAAHPDIRTLVFLHGDVLAVQDTGREGLGRGFAPPLHQAVIAGEGDRFTRIAMLEVHLQKTQGRAAVLKVERQRFPRLMTAKGLQCIVHHQHIVRHIRRNPHQRVSVDSLQ